MDRKAIAAAHEMVGNDSAAKPEAKENYIREALCIARDHGHVQPWSKQGLTQNTEVFVLPPTFSRDALFGAITEKAPKDLTLCKRSYEALFSDSEPLRSVVIGETAKGVCGKCMDWSSSIAALKTVV